MQCLRVVAWVSMVLMGSVAVDAVAQFQSELALTTSGWLQGTAYDDRTDTLFIGTSVSNVPYTCRIIAAQGITPALAAGSAWSWMDTGAGSCSGQMGAPTGVAWANGASFGRPDTSPNDVLFFSAYAGHSVWAYSPALKLTALVAGTGFAGATNGPGNLATFSNPEGIAFIDNVNGVARTSVIVADYGNSCVREVRIDWPPTSAFGAWDVTVATIAGTCGTGAPLQGPRNVAFGNKNRDMYVSDDGALRLLTGWTSRAPTLSTLTSSVGLSVAVLPASAQGVDYLVYVADGKFVIRAQPSDSSAVATLSMMDSPFSTESVRYVGWLPPGHLMVTTTTELLASTSVVLPPATRNIGDASTGSTNDTPSDSAAMWIVLAVGLPVAFCVGVAVACCVNRYCHGEEKVSPAPSVGATAEAAIPAVAAAGPPAIPSDESAAAGVSRPLRPRASSVASFHSAVPETTLAVVTVPTPTDHHDATDIDAAPAASVHGGVEEMATAVATAEAPSDAAIGPHDFAVDLDAVPVPVNENGASAAPGP